MRIRRYYDTACTCPAGSGIKCLGKCNHVGTILFVLEDFNRKKLKTFAEPLTCTSQLLKQNVPHDSSTNPSPIDKTIVKKIHLETIRTQKLNQKIIVMTHAHQYLGNDLQNCLLSSGLFLFYDIESKCSRNSEKEEIEYEVVKFIMYMKQMMTLTVKLKLLIIFPYLLMNFMIFHKILFKDMIDKYVVNISLTDEEIKRIEEKKNSQHLIFTLQLLTK